MEKCKLVISTVLKAGVINGNGRMYDEKALAAAFEQFKKRDHTMYGNLGYPESCVVDLSQVSHKVNKIKMKYDKMPRKLKKKLKKLGLRNNHCSLIAEIELLDTPKGLEAAKLMNDLVVRPAGFGTINKDNVVENYNLITLNLVDKDTDAFKGIIK